MRRAFMNTEKTTALVLMDLWAFAYAQDKSVRTLREFETACRLAERLSLPEARTYRDYVASLVREARESRKNRPSEMAASTPLFV
jgi:phytoene dehydrogenase-like protein